MSTNIKTYSELAKLSTFDERLLYAMLEGQVGFVTFGYDRYLNQYFYNNTQLWKRAKREVILRDNGCDLGVEGFDIHGPILVHHLTPITKDDILLNRPCLYDPDNLICVSQRTHNAIHYAIKSQITPAITNRKPNDTCPWKR